MATKKIYFTDEVFGLGPLSFPVLTFNERDEALKITQPSMLPEERAAVVYFGMLAETPIPTATGEYPSLLYEKFENDFPDHSKWAEKESDMKYKYLPWIEIGERTLQESYSINLYHLQQWLIKNKLWNGIEKTLAEESRKRQQIKAALDAQAAAAAKSLAYKRINEQEAAEVAARVEKEQAEIDRQLEEIKAGILPQEPVQTETTGGSSILPIAAAAAAAFFALKG